ncbi:MAG: fimbrillin family protein, partial [Rikenellaceae bacterium]
SADVTFTAYYPYSSSATAQSIPVDISAGEGAAEFLYASKTWSAADGTDSDIELIFEHKLAKVVLEITYSDSFEGLRATAPSASITDVPTTASYLVDGTLVEGSQGGNQDLTIQSSLNEVSAILLPGSYSSYIIFEIGSERYYVPYTKTLVAGTIYTHKLTFGQNEATLGEATIGDWVENNAA